MVLAPPAKNTTTITTMNQKVPAHQAQTTTYPWVMQPLTPQIDDDDCSGGFGFDAAQSFETLDFNTAQVFDTPESSTISPKTLFSTSSSSSELLSDLGQSPLFDVDEAELGDSSTWESLFPAETDEPVEIKQEESDSLSSQLASPVIDVASLNKPKPAKVAKASSSSAASTKRKKSESPEDYTDKRDSMGLTVYSRKPRSTPLTPIVVDGDDCVAAKRARNTEAARRSRARKASRMSELEDKVQELINRNTELEMEVERLKAERA